MAVAGRIIGPVHSCLKVICSRISRKNVRCWQLNRNQVEPIPFLAPIQFNPWLRIPTCFFSTKIGLRSKSQSPPRVYVSLKRQVEKNCRSSVGRQDLRNKNGEKPITARKLSFLEPCASMDSQKYYSTPSPISWLNQLLNLAKSIEFEQKPRKSGMTTGSPNRPRSFVRIACSIFPVFCLEVSCCPIAKATGFLLD